MLLTLLFIALLGGTYIHPTTPVSEIKQESQNDFLHKKEAAWTDTTSLSNQTYSTQTLTNVYQNTNTSKWIYFVGRSTSTFQNQYVTANYTTYFLTEFRWERPDTTYTWGAAQTYTYIFQLREIETFTQGAQIYNTNFLTEINTSINGQYQNTFGDAIQIYLKYNFNEQDSFSYMDYYIPEETQYLSSIETLKTSNVVRDIYIAEHTLVNDLETEANEQGNDDEIRWTPNTQINSAGTGITNSNTYPRRKNKMYYLTIAHTSTYGMYIYNTQTKTDITESILGDFNETIDSITWNATVFNKNVISANINVQYIPTQGGEVIDIGGLMFDIIGMPFTFISQAFNVTLFPGTQYQLNIGNLIKGLVAILTVLFIVKLFTKGIDVLGNYTGSIQRNKDAKEDRSWKREQRQMQREKHQKDMNKNE